MTDYQFPTAFIGHGGGPWPIISFDGFNEEERQNAKQSMENISGIPKQNPKTILVISAHWEGPNFKLNTNTNPNLLFDYYGFPEEAYQFEWPVKNDLKTITRIKKLLSTANIQFTENNKRDYDHGVFIPLMLAYPNADIPVIQLSLKRNLDPVVHFALGEILSPLRNEGVFIIGSGNSYHNLKEMFKPTEQGIKDSINFDNWLKTVIQLPAHERKKKLLEWEKAPGARECHPREEHFIPLLVAAGAASNDHGHISWTGFINGTANTSIHFA